MSPDMIYKEKGAGKMNCPLNNSEIVRDRLLFITTTHVKIFL